MGRKVKILYIDNAISYGGAIISISHLIRHLDKERFVPILISEIDKIALNHIISSGCNIYRIAHPVNYVHWMKITGRAALIKNNFLRKTFLYTCSFIRTFLNSFYFLHLLGVFLKEKPDLIHINNGMEIEEANIIGLVFNTKTIVHQRGDSKISLFRKILLKKVDLFIAVSNHTKNNMISWGIPAGKIGVMYDPVVWKEPNTVKLKKKYKINDDDKCIGIFGRIVRWKGQKIFIEAAISILRKHHNVRAFIVGDHADSDKDYYNDIRNIVNGSGVGDRFYFTGYVPNVWDFYSLMDIVVHASVEPEPFGMVINEAMMYGATVIASNEGGPLDIIQNGVDGLLIKPRDPKLLADTIEMLLNDDKKRKEMSEKAKLKVKTNFDIKTYTTKIEKLYDELLNKC